MQYRPYQRSAIDNTFEYLNTKEGNPLVVMPTGTGKSVVISGLCKEALEIRPDARIIILTHVKELIAQNFAALIRCWQSAPAGIYSAGLNQKNLNAQIIFAGIQSIAKKAYHVQRCDLVLIDECQLLGRKSTGLYQHFLRQLIEINPDLKIIGFTATPFRMDSGKLHQGDDRLFTDIAVNVPILDMFKQGYLAPVTTIPTATVLDVSGVGTLGGDFKAGELERAMMRNDNSVQAVREMVTLGADRKSWLVFCAGVDHATEVRDAIRENGIECETITGETPAGQRDFWIKQLKSGQLRALTNANVLTTGFDAPCVDLLAMLRPTKSKGLYMQIIGRGTRPVYAGGYDLDTIEGRFAAMAAGPKQDCLVLDFAGNVTRHGPIDLIEGDDNKEKGDGDAPMKLCPQCDAENFAGVRICVECGFEFPPPETALSQKASDAAIISTQAVPVWLDVHEVSYAAHNKPGKPPSLQVTYRCGMTWHREWICLEHTGYPREKAAAWWRSHSTTPLPNKVETALATVAQLRKPSSIRVRPVGKFTEIQSHRFAA